ncbi:hypothetical protein FQN57_003021 [Myotisia sp. PD_48]|nr:hypothetical protein FQN57_003021 [Myotisia sp. PD_48]
MSSALSKRQQARNERALQELITTTPGNDRCADCQARNPGWASWNLGIFLCLRCATLHRKLGTHISKVKSLSMDSWSSDQVDYMKKNGNTRVNKVYNPKNIKPAMPIDIDEADYAIERFIRQKYESRILEDGKPKPPSRHDPSYISKRVEESPPPPLPPKPKSRFGFGLRSISSSHSSDKGSSRRDSLSPTFPNKPSKTFGVSLGNSGGSMDSKLTALREMGFPDDKRNSTVLRGFNGDMERAVDTLTRLGERQGTGTRSRSPAPARLFQSGAKMTRSADNKSPAQTDLTSTNPFDKLDSMPQPVVGISFNSTANDAEQPANKYQPTSYNPFDVQPARPNPQPNPVSLEGSFQNLQVSQPLFPNMTGGYPSQQANIQAAAKYQQSMTPPVTMSQQYGFVAAPMNGNYNPFFPQSMPTTPSAVVPNNLGFAQSQNLSPTNPYFTQASSQNIPQAGYFQSQQSNSQGNSPGFTLQHAYTMPNFTSNSASQPQIYNQQSANNPFFMQNYPNGNHQYPAQFQQQQQQQQHQQPIPQQQQNRVDKSSILALYNFSQPPPTIPEQPQQGQPEALQHQLPQLQTQSLANSTLQSQTNSPLAMSAPADSLSTSRNPFFNSANMAPNQPAFAPENSSNTTGLAGTSNPSNNQTYIRSHMSQESMDIRKAQPGRHSPDFFANLSSRYV